MGYLLYLRKSFLRQPKRHLALYVILTCAFILPLLISIYRDSSAYGERQQVRDITKGATFHIVNACPEDAELFEGIEGLSEPRYEDGIIYLGFLSDEDWRDGAKVDRCGAVIMQIIGDSGRSDLYPTAYPFDYTIESDAGDEQTALLLLNVLIMVISSFIVGSAYRSHLRRFSPDVGVLRSCGAEDWQICALFLGEFVTVFALSSVSALLISALVMKLLFAGFLEVREGGFAWLIFHMDPGNTALHIGVFFSILLAVITFTLTKTVRDSVSGAMRSDIQTMEMKRRPPGLRLRASPERSLLSLWLRRTNRAHTSCLLAAAPILTVFLFLFSYLSLNAAWVSRGQECELTVSKNGPAGGFTGDEIESVESLAPVEEVAFRGGQSDGVYVIDIRLTSPELHRDALELLERLFPRAEYEITDNLAEAERGREMSAGIYLMLTFIFVVMLVFMLIIVYMKLCNYIQDSRKTVKALSNMGASDEMIEGSYIRQSAVSAAAASILPAFGSAALFIPAASGTAQKPAVGLPVIFTYFAVTAVTFCAFILPVRRSVRQILIDISGKGGAA